MNNNPITKTDILSLKVLLLEDTAEDVKLILRRLKKNNFNFQYQHASNATEFFQYFNEFDPDIVLADYHIPGFSGLEALDFVRRSEGNRPFIFVTGTLGEDKAVETIKLGADDFILKDNLLRLPTIMLRALREHQQLAEKRAMQEQLQEQHNFLTTLIESIPETMSYRNQDGTYLMVNRAFEKLTGKDRSQILNHKEPGVLNNDLFKVDQEANKEVLRFKEPLRYQKATELINGKQAFLEISKSPVLSREGKVEGIVSITRDITEFKEKETILLEKEHQLNEAQRIAKLGSFNLNIMDKSLIGTTEFCNILGLKSCSNKRLVDYFEKIHPADKDFVIQRFEEAISNLSEYEIDHRIQLESGEMKIVKSAGKVFKKQIGEKVKFELIGTILDITAKRNADKALHQGQELERKRLSREIHDGVSQMLIAMKYNLMLLEEELEEGETDNSLKYINTLDSTIDNVVDETRRIINNLSIKSIEEFGVQKAIESLCNQMQNQNSFEIAADVDLEDEQVDESVSIALYRVIQEALNNVAKYAEAEHVELSLKQGVNSLELVIADDGKGIDKSKVNLSDKGGNGLLNMKERVGIFNGSMSVSSSQKAGTTIMVQIPNSSVKKVNAVH